jgi:hypothetical protein
MRCFWKSIGGAVNVRGGLTVRRTTPWARHLGGSLVALAIVSAPSVADEVTVPHKAVAVPVVAGPQPRLQTLEWAYRPGLAHSGDVAEGDGRSRWHSRRTFAEPYWRDPRAARGSWSRYDPVYRRDRWSDRRITRREWYYEGGWWWPPETRSHRR